MRSLSLAGIMVTISIVSYVCPVALQAQSRLVVEVVGEDGRALSNAAVQINRLPQFQATARGLPELVRDEAVFNRTISSQLDGRAEPPDLPPGRYHICVELEGYLDPCKWGASPSFELSSEQATTPKRKVSLEAGVAVDITIEDALRIVGRRWKPEIGVEDVIVGIHVPEGLGSYSMHQLQSVDGTGLKYHTTVPKDTPLHVWIYSRDLIIEDARGSELPLLGAKIPFTADGLTPQSFRFYVASRVQEASQ